MAREIVLDTETTGFDPKTGDRLIEVGCIEIDDLLPTGRTFHRYVNPDRLIPEAAIRAHGITDDKVKDAPRFHEIVDDLIEFIGDAPMIAHNAGFDRNFIDAEYVMAGRKRTDPDRWIDTLALAQKRFPGMPNSLDALCKRFKVSLADRTFHGALIDARLLAEVYLELRGGKERVLDLSVGKAVVATDANGAPVGRSPRPTPLAPRSTPDEQARHVAFLQATLKDRSLWTGYGLKTELETETAPAS